MQLYINKTPLESILAVVVIYNMNVSDSASIRSIQNDLKSFDSYLDLLVYDNSPFPQEIPDLEMIHVIKYQHDPSNRGVSYAYNQGAAFAESIGKKWLLLLDQDTFFNRGIINAYLEAMLHHPQINLFSPLIKLENGTIFSPFRKWLKRGFTLKKVDYKSYSIQKYAPVNSGILVTVASFLEVGGYNPRVKMDFSDLQFSERFKIRHSLFNVVPATAVQHFSNDETDSNKLNIRFQLFCDGARNCDKLRLGDHIQFFIVVLLRTFILTYRTRKTVFLRTFFSNYLL